MELITEYWDPYTVWTHREAGSYLIEAWERPVRSTRAFERLWSQEPVTIAHDPLSRP
jgi:hypothetical protein